MGQNILLNSRLFLITIFIAGNSDLHLLALSGDEPEL